VVKVGKGGPKRFSTDELILRKVLHYAGIVLEY
jgi:hypothetical protein